MDKQLLRPRKLSINPEEPDATLVFNFWLRTVEDFIAGLQEPRREGDPEINKKHIIVNCLSPTVYPHVKEATTYDAVVTTLGPCMSKGRIT